MELTSFTGSPTCLLQKGAFPRHYASSRMGLSPLRLGRQICTDKEHRTIKMGEQGFDLGTRKRRKRAQADRICEQRRLIA